jgi:SAM-dependent methyltransferase
MGQWSNALAPLFLRFALVEEPRSLLDVGAGTGSLLAAAAAMLPHARLAGIDPSAALLSRARRLPELAHADLREGVAEHLPFAPGSFDACLSLLVLQEFCDPPAALREFKRVTKPGGIVAAALWKFEGMPVIIALLDALAAVEPANVLASRPARPYQDEGALAAAWKQLGLRRVSAQPIKVERTFRDFDELWTPLLSGPTPSTKFLATLSKEKREAVCEHVRLRLTKGPGPFSLTAEALAVRGVA